MYLTQDYQDIIELLNAHEVRYLIAGAYAMAVFGYARSTYDIDIWIAKDDQNIDNVLGALEDFGVPFELDKKDLQKKDNVIQIGIAPNRIDILTDIDGVDFEEAWQNKKIKQIEDININFLDLKDLIKNKSSTQRAKDQLDLLELTKLLKKG